MYVDGTRDNPDVPILEPHLSKRLMLRTERDRNIVKSQKIRLVLMTCVHLFDVGFNIYIVPGF